MIAIWTNGYDSKWKDTYFIDTDDLTGVTPQAVDDILKAFLTFKGFLIGTVNSIDFVRTTTPKRLNSIIRGYGLARVLQKLANGTKGRLHRIDPHHAIVAQLIRQYKSMPLIHDYGDVPKLDALFTSLYGYSPLQDLHDTSI